jgi:predicted MFS family arabinose efflux permease
VTAAGSGAGTAAASAAPAAAASGGGRRAEWAAVGAHFLLLGYAYGNWVARIPAVADATDAGPGALGAALLAITAGAAVSMPLVGRLCARRPTRSVVPVAGLLTALTLPLPALARSPWTLAAALAAFGMAQGALDVSMNANAVAAVRRAGRPLMPAFHGMFSVGGLVGAAIGGLAAAAGIGVLEHLTAAAAVSAVICLVAARWLPPDPAARPADPGRPHVRVRIDVLLIVLGAIGFCSALGEGAMADWSALFLHTVLRAGEGAAAAGYAAFSIAMAATRFGGAAVLARYDPGRVLTAGCALAAAGALATVLAPVAALAIVGFAAVGVGLSCAFPVLINAAGAHPLGSGPAISVVTTVGYTGFLAGPPLIGAIAQATGLRVGLAVVAVVAAAGAVMAARLREQLRRHDPSRPDAGP